MDNSGDNNHNGMADIRWSVLKEIDESIAVKK